MKMKILDKAILVVLVAFFAYMVTAMGDSAGMIFAKDIVFTWVGVLMFALIAIINLEAILFE